MNNLRSIIEDEIKRHGIIPFARFMELALYCPNSGYYERLNRSPGRQGDFFTSVSVGSLFGELLAWQFAGWLDEFPGASRQIVEAGAHDGQLARDVLKWLQGNRPDLFDTIEYWILEPSERRRHRQEEILAEFGGRVKWFAGWHEIPEDGISGVIFSNELLDAMPVHRLGWDAAKKEWFEWAVGLDGTEFVWERNPNSEIQYPKLTDELLGVLPDGFTTEVCPAAVNWWRKAAQALRRGKLLTLDYGLDADEFFVPARRNGTVRAYQNHGLSDDLLAQPGERDLTAHVNFTAIRETGEAAGLTTEALVTQTKFLMSIVQNLVTKPEAAALISSRNRELQTLTHPQHLGQKFQVLVQSRAEQSR